ncbi:MAG: MFS transporter [Rhodobacteraceae bacterium]|nr:MFS transporter [Paracoccaceae bacterium]
MKPNQHPMQLIPVVAIPIFLAIANQTMVSVALPAIGADLGALSRLPWLIIGYMLALTIAGPVYGALGDNYGRHKMLIGALLIYIIGAFICTFANTLEMLAAGRLVQGFGGGGLMSLSQALIGQLVRPRDRGRAQGYVASIGVVASTLGPLMGGFLVDIYGWRSLFLFTVPLAVISMGILLTRRFPKPAGPPRAFDTSGFLWLNFFVICWTMALEFIKTPGQLHLSLLAVIGGAVGLWMLIRSQKSGANPLFPPALFRIKAVSMASAMTVFHGAALVSLVTIVPLFQNIVRGDDTVEIALSLLALTVAFGLSGIITGNLITITGRTAIFPTVSLLIAGAGIVFIALFGAEISHRALIATYTIIGLNIGSVMAVIHTTVQHATPDNLRGRAAGTVTFCRSIGAVLGTTAVSLILFKNAPLTDGSQAAIASLFTQSSETDPALLAVWKDAFRLAFLTIVVFVAGEWAMAAATPARRISETD